jgi:hypothetical protein
VLSGVFIVEEVDGVGEKGSGDTTAVDVQTLLETFLNMTLRSAYFTDEAFLVAKILRTTFLKCQIVRSAKLSGAGLKEFYCILLSVVY